MYEVAAAMNDIEFRKVQLRPDFSMDTEAMLSAADSKTRLMFICSPNNPTGNSFPVDQIEDILERFGGVVVLDEAYIDFSVRPSLTSLVKRYPNLIVLQTLSKAWGMAGLRIGLAIADPAVIALMSKVKYPYNINVLAQKMALMKLDEAAKDKAVAEIVGQRFRLEKELAKCPEVKGIYSSDANFLLVRFENPDEVYERLLAGGVIVRNRSKVSGCEGCLRITVGTPVENDRLLRLLSSSVAEPVEATTPGMKILGERHIRIVRNTKETKISLELDLDSIGGSGRTPPASLSSTTCLNRSRTTEAWHFQSMRKAICKWINITRLRMSESSSEKRSTPRSARNSAWPATASSSRWMTATPLS